jgi:hypothetical protein
MPRLSNENEICPIRCARRTGTRRVAITGKDRRVGNIRCRIPDAIHETKTIID